MNESWKPVLGYKGLYEISDCGNVRSLIQKPPRLLKPAIGTSGYRYVQLTKHGEPLPKMIHRLVIEAFEGEIPPRIEVNHKNGVKTDNRLENLEKMSRSENMIHRVRVLGIKPVVIRGIQNWHATFTEEQVRTIRRMHDERFNAGEIARKFNCTRSAIHHIIKRRSWNHI